MVTVVATQELKAEHFLLRFKAEATHIHGSRSISARPVFGNGCYTWDSFHLCVVFLLSFPVGSPACVCAMICAVFLLMFDFFARQQHMLVGSWLAEM